MRDLEKRCRIVQVCQATARVVPEHYSGYLGDQSLFGLFFGTGGRVVYCSHSHRDQGTREANLPVLCHEVKADPKLHRRISDMLSWFPLRVGRNSKYVDGLLDVLCFL